MLINQFRYLKWLTYKIRYYSGYRNKNAYNFHIDWLVEMSKWLTHPSKSDIISDDLNVVL